MPHVAIEHLTCDWSNSRWAVSARNMLDFEALAFKKHTSAITFILTTCLNDNILDIKLNKIIFLKLISPVSFYLYFEHGH